MSAGQSFTGYVRQRKTRLGVRFGEITSRLFITLGGIGTIIAIVLVCVFLVWVAVPLFFSADAQEVTKYSTHWKGKPLRVGVDPDHALAWALFPDGTLSAFSVASGTLISEQQLFPGRSISAVSPPSRGEHVLIGFTDGSMALGKIGFDVNALEGEKIPPGLRDLPDQGQRKRGQALAARAGPVVRTYQLKPAFETPVKLDKPSPVLLVDLTVRPEGPVLCSLTADGLLRLSEITTRPNFSGGDPVKEISGGEIAVKPRGTAGLPRHLGVTGLGDAVFLAWEDGIVQVINTRNLEKPRFVEEVKVTTGDSRLTTFHFMIGKTTLLIGDSQGGVSAWFRINTPGSGGTDGKTLVNAHTLSPGPTAVTALASSARSRVMAAGYGDGTIRLFYLTNHRQLAELHLAGSDSVETLLFTPKEDGIAGLGEKQFAYWSLNVAHPEVSLAALTRPVWYEDAPQPVHAWQTSGADDSVEPKFGLWPLVFGTLKATLYSLLIGVPLALFAAVYSREFLHPRVRGVVKPTVEVMASLPSVVLGFLAGLVVAPFVERVLPVVIAGFLIVPFGFVLAGFLWHCLSGKWIRQIQGKKFYFIALVLPCTILAAIALGAPLERALFGGDVKAWLADKKRPVGAGWLPLLLPLTGVLTVYLIASFVNPWLRRLSRRVSASREAFLNLAKCLGGIAFAVALAWLAGLLLVTLGIDPRDSFFGQYDQKNALVVGFIMGFAIIPIIYTLADDALAAVPDHLRSASLGAGATPWQTASRIVIPTALAGIFSAIVVGLGRAVGETMIVLMAAGNTPVTELNVFNGFRTLSATIAVELPEAVQNSTHFRMLFLAALTLFAMTFLLNSVAEAMRQRFRRRAFEL